MAISRHVAALAMAAAAAALTAISGPAAALEMATGGPDKTLSPYFMVKGSDGETDRLPLKDTRADVDISGVIAHVKVTQTYENDGQHALEAVYVFPGSTRSAVFAMRMKIGDRTIEAKIEEKEQARKIYEAAKQAGQSASLLEQNRPNVFTMNVANIMPGDTIKVELDYVEVLMPTDGVYEFTYPTVVGPRYSEKTEQNNPGEGWLANPHLKAGQTAPYTWDMAVNLNAGMKLSAVGSSSHQIQTSFIDGSHARIDVNDPAGGNRDFVLRYRLAGDKVATGLLTFPGQKENFFLAMVQPPRRVTRADKPAREYIFIIDVSGSMMGFPLGVSKSVMRSLLGGMTSRDRFNIMFFSGGSWVLADQSLPATKRNVSRALALVDRQRGGGGTRIREAMQKALAMPRSRDMSTSFVVLTDGYVSVEKETFDLIRDHLGEANLFAIGVGSSVNRFLIEGMARAGMGEPFVALNAREGRTVAKKFSSYAGSPVLTNVQVSFPGMHAYDVVPRQVPDVFAQRPVLVFGKYRGKAGSVRVTGQSGRGRFAATVSANAIGAQHNEALRYLWARHQIQELSDYQRVARDSELAKRITQLGLTYNLMTQYTSFVAVDTKVRNHSGLYSTVRQALPMPQGVPNSAIGGARAGTGMGMGMGTASAPARRARARYKRKEAAAPRGQAVGLTAGRSATELKPDAAPAAEPADEERDEAAPSPATELRRLLQARGIAHGLAIRVVVNASGRVTSVKVLHTTLAKADLARALHLIKQHRFRGGRATFTLRF